jgi:hypothetical protein
MPTLAVFHTPADWTRQQVAGARASLTSHPTVRNWADTVPLKPARIPPKLAGSDAVATAEERLSQHVEPEMTKMAEFLGCPRAACRTYPSSPMRSRPFDEPPCPGHLRRVGAENRDTASTRRFRVHRPPGGHRASPAQCDLPMWTSDSEDVGEPAAVVRHSFPTDFGGFAGSVVRSAAGLVYPPDGGVTS